MPGRSANRLYLSLGSLAALGSLLLLGGLLQDLKMGLQTLGWTRIQATVVVAYFHKEYDPVGSHGMDWSIHKTWSGLALAYTTLDGQHHVTTAFDAAGLTPGREWFVWPFSARVRHILNQGDAPWVFYNPQDPREAVMHPGIPFTTGVVLVLPLSLLTLVLYLLRYNSAASLSARRLSPDAAVGVWVVALVFFAIIGVGLSHTWMSIAGVLPPWWLFPLGSLLLIGYVVFPRASPRTRDLFNLLLAVMFILGFAGWFLSREETFGVEWSDADLVERLVHEHPRVAEQAALHFV